jgi:hypothetical protein
MIIVEIQLIAQFSELAVRVNVVSIPEVWRRSPADPTLGESAADPASAVES